MNTFDSFISFFECNKQTLHSDELRPAKSITRNIISGVKPFVDFYKSTLIISLSGTDISSKILHLDTQMSSTTRDNIRNLEELRFIAKIGDQQKYRFTRNFAEFVNSGLHIKEYVLKELKQIKSIDEITMFYNCILCLLYEATKYGYVCGYPDSFSKFVNMIPDFDTRVDLCKKVEDIYGFKSRGKNYGEYTPNANYRFLSTCVSLDLIVREGNDGYGFNKFILTDYGKKTLVVLNSNLSWFKDDTKNTIIPGETFEEVKEVKLYDDEWDKDYVKDVDNIPKEMLEDFIDMPLPLANTFGNYSNKRDPRKGANAKRRANYMCEFDSSHKSFATTNSSNYVEAHHLLPLSIQKQFMCSLDVEANIVALCSHCHNLLHYGEYEEKKSIIVKLYNERIERLKNCGIYIPLNDLLNVYK